jgi:hypothetical protein
VGLVEPPGARVKAIDDVVRAAGEVAKRLGNAVVSPVVALPQEHFEKLLEFAARSFQGHGFVDIVLLADSGGNDAGQRAVAQALNKEWASTPVRVHSVEANYDAAGTTAWLRQQGETTENIGTHAERIETRVLSLSDFVVPNADEASTLTGIEVKDPSSAGEAARHLRALGAATACVKLSDGGCVVADSSALLPVRPPSADVVDTTGAGDAFAGALATALVLGHGTADAVRWAVAASRLAVTGYGSQPAYPDREELEKAARQVQASEHAR